MEQLGAVAPEHLPWYIKPVEAGGRAPPQGAHAMYLVAARVVAVGEEATPHKSSPLPYSLHFRASLNSSRGWIRQCAIHIPTGIEVVSGPRPP